MSKEYIEREALYRVVTEKYHDLVAGPYPYNIVAYDMAQIVKSQPAADVVEVVRCKDCKHKVNFQNRIMCDRNARCSSDCSEWYGLTATNNDNFCNFGKRKDGADNG